jgi:hypothetical protein
MEDIPSESDEDQFVGQLTFPRVVSHQKLPLNLSLSSCVLVVVLWRKWLLVSVNHFMPTASATVYSRPRDTVARTECLVELVVGSLVKVRRVLV